MQKKTTVYLSLMMLILALFIPTKTAFAISNVNLKVEEKLPLETVIQLPSLGKEAEGLKIKWDSSDKTVSLVDYSNKIAGLKKGTATITGKINDVTVAQLHVTVISTVQGVELEQKAFSMVTGEQKTIKAFIKPYNAFSKTVKWKSSDTKIATVASNGTVKALAVGKVKISAETMDGGYVATSELTVTSPATGIHLTQKELSLSIGETKPLGATTVSSTAYIQTLLYISSNKDVASIDKNGKVTALKEGNTTITIYTIDKKYKQTMTIRVISNIDTLYIGNDKGAKISSVSLKVGQPYQLLPVGDPKNVKALAGYKVLWKTSNSSVVTVDRKGVLRAIGAGTVAISITLPQELKPLKATISVKTVSTVQGVKLNKTALKLPVGGTENLQATVSPSTAYLKDVAWKSENTKIVTISSKGEVKGTGVGVVKVTATTKDGKKVSTATITVNPIAKGIQVPSTSLKLYLGSTQSFKATVYPNNTLVKTITHKFLTKDGGSLVKVAKSADGTYTLTGLKPGKTQLELTSQDGGYKKVISLEVLSTKIDVDLYQKTDGKKIY